MFGLRSECRTSTPVSTTATMTSGEPVEMSKAAGAFTAERY
jgi:hypothetical protein